MQESHDNTKKAKEAHYSGVVFGIPTFGMASINFLTNMNTKGMPIFTNAGYHVVQGKPVDVARNEIAAATIINRNSYLIFRDDDTLAPHDAIPKLIQELHGSKKLPPIEPNEYDNLYIVSIPWFGKVKTLRLKFGRPYVP